MSLSAAMIFGNNMVLQRGKKIPVWGTAESGSMVTVETDWAAAKTIAKDGLWKAELPPMHAYTGGRMVISDDRGGRVEFTNIAVGEVWVAGGQSNMEMCMYADGEYDAVRPNASNPNIRFFDYPEVSYEGQLDDEDFSEYGFWRLLTPDDLQYFSAAGYYFAELLHAQLDVPIGVVGCNWGGTPASAWIDERYLTGDLECYLRDREEVRAELDMDKYVADFKKEREAATTPEAKARTINMMKTPWLKPIEMNFPTPSPDRMRLFLNGPYSPLRASGLYHCMLEKIIPYAIAGAIWYQGESDTHRSYLYDQIFGEMIRCWRESWNDQFPFLFVQLAPLGTFVMNDGRSFIPIRALQEKVSKTVPDTYMACIMDAGMEFDIHPKRKRPVGERLALLALGKAYGKQLLCESPEAVSAEKKDGCITVKFSNAGGGLHVDGEQINALELAVGGEPVTDYSACVSGPYLKVSSDKITQQAEAELKLAWVGFCVDNLYNSAGLPAVPFEMKI